MKVIDTGQSYNVADAAEEDGTIEEYFEVGDHIYSWCPLFGIPRVFTHHGIVIDRVQSSVPGAVPTVTILDFSCLVDDDNNNKHKSSAKSSSIMSSKNDNLILHSYTISVAEALHVWNKVEYQATVVEKYRSRRKSDPVETVLARTQFLLQNHRHNTTILATYDTIQSNCEHGKSKCRSPKN